jgi:hypothetical protein
MEVSDKGDLSAVLRTWIRGYIRDNLDTMLPVQVTGYDAKTNKVTVKPLIRLVSTDGTEVERAEIANIPVFRFGNPRFFITLQQKAGDFGWLMANDRDISLFLQSYQANRPNTARLHSFSDAVFFPDAINYGDADAYGEGGLILQSYSGDTAIHMKDNGDVDVKGGAVNVIADMVNLGDGASTPLTMWPDLQTFLVSLKALLDTGTTPAGGPVTFPDLGALTIPSAGTTKIKGV